MKRRIKNRDRWETHARANLGKGLTIKYSTAPSGMNILSFSKNRANGIKHFGFWADDEVIYNLLDFLHSDIMKEYEVRLSPEMLSASEYFNEVVLETYLSQTLGHSKIKREEDVAKIFKETYKQLGFDEIIELRREFPDAICKKGGETVFVELEELSVNFKYHKHDPDKCDYIVCFFHNWIDPPPNLKIIPLYHKLLGMMEVNVAIGDKKIKMGLSNSGST